MMISKKNQKRNLTRKTFTALKSVCAVGVANEDVAEEIDHRHVTDENDRDQSHESVVQVAIVVNEDLQEIAIATEANHVTEVTATYVGVIHAARVVMSEVLEAMFGDHDMTFEDLERISGSIMKNCSNKKVIIISVKKMIEKCAEVDRSNLSLRNDCRHLLKIN